MLLKTPPNGESASNSAGLASPTIIVALVILLGATLYLWRARYIRPTTAYATLAILGLALILIGAWTYTSGQ